MTRLITSGLEVYVTPSPAAGDTVALQEVGAPDGFAIGAACTRTTTAGQFRSGVAGMRCNPAAATAYNNWTFTGVLDRWYYVRGYLKINSLPTGSIQILRINSGTSSFVSMDTSGRVNSQNASGSLSAALNDGNFHRIEYGVKASATQASRAWELRVDGVVISSGTNQTLDSTAPTSLQLGVVTSGTCDLFFDDVALNDDQGLSQNTFPGDGYVILLKPVSDSAIGSWTGGAGGVTSLFDAIDNTPPVGAVAPGTNTQQIRANAVATTGTFRTNTYSAGGASAGSTVIGAVGFLCSGEEVATGTKSGTAADSPGTDGATFLPGTSWSTFNFGNDIGAEGAWPSLWRWSAGTFRAIDSSPSNLATDHLISITTTTSTRVASCCFLGLYAELIPPGKADPTEMHQQRRRTSRRRVISVRS